MTRVLRQPVRSATGHRSRDEPALGAPRAADKPPTEPTTTSPPPPCCCPCWRPGHAQPTPFMNAPPAGTGSPASVAAPSATCSPDASARAAVASPAVRSSPSTSCSTSHCQPTSKLSDPVSTITNENDPPSEGHLHRTRDANPCSLSLPSTKPTETDAGRRHTCVSRRRTGAAVVPRKRDSNEQSRMLIDGDVVEDAALVDSDDDRLDHESIAGRVSRCCRIDFLFTSRPLPRRGIS